MGTPPRPSLLFSLLLAACGPGVAPLESGELAIRDAKSPASIAEEDWTPIAMPDRWSSHDPEAGGTGWYRFRLDEVDTSEPRWGVFLPRLRMNAAVYVNGAWIGDGGRLEPPVAQSWNRPLYFEFPRALLRGDGTDVLHVRLFTYPHDGGGLGRLYVGPHEALVGAYEWQQAMEVELARVVLFSIVVVVFLLAGLMLSRHWRQYFWLLPCAGFLAIHSLAGQIHHLPVPYELTRWALHAAMDGFAVSLATFVHRWADDPHPRLERGMWAALVVGLVTTALVDPAQFRTATLAVHAFALAVGAHAFVVVFRALRRAPGVETVVGVGFGVGALAIAAMGLGPYIGLIPPESPRLIILMGPWMLVAFGCLLAIRYARASREAAMNEAQLRARVDARESELKHEFARAQKLEQARAIHAERERLMREMHDGLGGQLVGMLNLVQRGEPTRDELEEALESSLDDMRMVIDALDPDVDGLPTLLGMMRVRLGRRIRNAGVRLDWRVTELPHLPWLGRGAMTHVQRIVQESITNALKHAGADVITVETGVTPAGRVYVRIADDGVGLPDAPTLGRGLRNIEHRAAEIGAELEVTRPDGGGTEVRLELPRESMVQSRSSRPSWTAS